MQELQRWRDQLNMPLTLEPKYFPVSDKLAAAMLIRLRQQQKPDAALRLAGACLRACWEEDRDISDTQTLQAIATENALDATELLIDVDKTLQTRAADSEEAVKVGVFGAPSYLYNNELFWGQDRLEFLDRALERH